MKRKALLLLLMLALGAPWAAWGQETTEAKATYSGDRVAIEDYDDRSNRACDISEDFSGVTPIVQNTSSSNLPNGWAAMNVGSGNFPTVTSDGTLGTNYLAFSTNENYLYLVSPAGSSSTYNGSIVVLPCYRIITNFSFSYQFEHTSSGTTFGTFVVGYATSQSFTSIGDITVLETVTNSSTLTTFSLSSSSIQTLNNNNGYLVLWYYGNNNTSYEYGIGVNNICIGLGSTTMTCGQSYSGTVGNSYNAWSSYSNTGASWPENGEEHIYSYTPPVTSSYTFTCGNVSNDPDFFLLDTPNPTGNGIGYTSDGDITATLTGGITYYLIVDNYSSSSSNYTVSVSCPSFSITAWDNPTGAGTISGAGTYDYGTSCTLTATAASGYTFDYWIKNGTETIDTNPYTFTVTADADFQAHFTEVYLISDASDITTCSGTIYDSGGPNGNYSNSEDYTKTIYPGTPGMAVKLEFTVFETENVSYDYIEIYDGTSTNATLIGKYGGTNSPGIVVASNPTGALTLKWHSDTSVNKTGFAAIISCGEPTPVVTISNVTANSATASWTGASSSYTVRYGAANPYIDFETGDMSQASFTYSGGNWTTSTTSPYNGSYCAKSGNAGTSSSTSYMEVSVTLSSVGFVSFAGKVSSETCCDHGYFYIDGTQQVRVADDAAWHTYSYELTAGTHTLRWAYTKDGSVNSGDDCFYVDDIMVADLVNTATTSSTSYNMTGLTMGTWYMATVQGANSDMSDPVVFQTPSTHTLTASVNPANSGTISDGNNNISGATTYNHGTSVTLTATPNTGYDFIGWTVDGSSVGITNPTTVTMDQDHSVVANFEPQRFTISASANPSAGGSVSGAGTYNYNTSCTLSTTVNNGYTFTGWFENNTRVSTNTSYTFTVTAARTLEARFTQDTYIVNVSASPAAGGTVSGGGTFTYGAPCTITATAIPGYSFSHWTDNGTQVSGASSTYQFAVTSAHNFVAIFTHDQYNITYTNDGNGSCSGVTTAYYGDNVTVTVTPNAGYELNTLTYNDGTSHTITVSGNQGSFTMPLHAVTVNATFNKINYSISYNNVGNGTVTGPASALYGTTVTVTLTEGTGYHLTAITATANGTSIALDGSGNTRTFTMPAGDVSVEATFDIIQYTVNIASLGNGNAHIEVGGTTVIGSSTTVNYGTQVTITATPDSGYSLVNWTNDLNATTVTDNPYQFTANETFFGDANSITLVANFDLTPPSFTTTVNSVTDNSANMSGRVTYGGNITEYGFCWNTTGETPTTLVSGSYYRVGNGVPSASFTQNITGLTSNTLYYVWSYVVSNSTVMCGDMQTFTTLAQVTTASATNVTTYDATMGGSWATGGDATITGCGVVYGTGNTPTIGDGTSTQVAMASPSSPFTLQNSSNLLAETTYYVRAYVTNAGGTSYGAAVPFTTLGYYGIAYMVSPAASDGVITFSPAGDGQGQGTKVIPVGTGNNASQMFPFMGTTSTTSTSFDEMLYPALTIDGNAVQGDIQSISFFVKTKATGAQNPTLSIYLMETSSTTLTSGVAIPVANLCYSGTVSVSNLNTWVDITLDTPFAYQGGNLIVAVDYSGSGAYTWASSDATGKSLCFMSSVPSGGNINGVDPAWTEDQMGQLSSNQLPNAKFTIATASGNTEWCSYGYTTTASASTLNPDYVFDHWTVDGNDVTGNTPTYTFSNITANHTITANFVLTYKRFFTDGNWNVAGNWDPEGVPTLSDEIAIEANAIIPSGVIGYANKIRPITHANSSITIKDGGQLVHNNGSNNMVTVTVENDIDGYTAAEANTNKGYEIVSFPVDNLTAGNSAITGVFTGSQHPFDFYRFDASVDPLEWVHMASNSAISLLDGFIYASQDGTTIRVTGPVMSSASNYSSSDVTFLDNDAPRFNGWALMGNPFVCNAYVSLGTNNGAGAEANFYKLYNNTDYDEFIPFSSGDAVTPMGGVMFRVYDDDNIVYSRTAPSGAKTGILNVDVRKTTSRGTTTIDRARVRFGEGRNLEKFQFDTRHTKIYIPEGDQDFSVYYADGAGTIPVNFKAQDNGRYTLDFSTEEVGFNYLHLIDNMNGNDVDLLQTPYYAFDAKSTDFASRFTLVFATGNDNDDTFAFFNNGVWIINNDGDATLQVVDALGRMLSSENISGSTSKAINVAPGVYMLRLINGDKVKVQKIVVKR